MLESFVNSWLENLARERALRHEGELVEARNAWQDARGIEQLVRETTTLHDQRLACALEVKISM